MMLSFSPSCHRLQFFCVPSLLRWAVRSVLPVLITDVPCSNTSCCKHTMSCPALAKPPPSIPIPSQTYLPHEIFRLTHLIQAGAAAYLAHMFASSLMSRWLLHYSPLAVLVRLCSLSLILSFVCLQTFQVTAATSPHLILLSRSLPCWIFVSVVLMLAYFSTQQDISVETDRDDRRRRVLLRLKCLYVVGACSLFSLMVVVGIVHSDSLGLEDVDVRTMAMAIMGRWREFHGTFES